MARSGLSGVLLYVSLARSASSEELWRDQEFRDLARVGQRPCNEPRFDRQVGLAKRVRPKRRSVWREGDEPWFGPCETARYDVGLDRQSRSSTRPWFIDPGVIRFSEVMRSDFMRSYKDPDRSVKSRLYARIRFEKLAVLYEIRIKTKREFALARDPDWRREFALARGLARFGSPDSVSLGMKPEYAWVCTKPEYAWLGTEPEYAWLGTEPEYAWLGTEPEYAWLGTEPEYAWLGTEPEYAWLGTEPDYAWLGTEPEYAWLGTESEYALLGTEPEYAWLGTEPEYAWLGTEPEYAWLGTEPEYAWLGTEPEYAWLGTEPEYAWLGTEPEYVWLGTEPEYAWLGTEPGYSSRH
ncbi:unnamed protein product [Arabidopsis lyrata]|nr:unnamed protein product [Arabidopsis lyrata]